MQIVGTGRNKDDQRKSLKGEKAHCVMGFQSEHRMSGSLSVYAEIETNKYEFIGSGELSFISMKITPRKYLLVLEDCRPGMLLVTCSLNMNIGRGCWATDL